MVEEKDGAVPLSSWLCHLLHQDSVIWGKESGSQCSLHPVLGCDLLGREGDSNTMSVIKVENSARKHLKQ